MIANLRFSRAAAWALAGALLLLMRPLPLAAQSRLLDDFSTLAGWQAFLSEGAKASLASVPSEPGRALRLTFDLSVTHGYAIARKDLALDLPADYEFTFDLRADAPVNNFEFKLTDADGNVWWIKRLNITYPTQWTRMHLRRRQLSFAWGPDPGREMRGVKSIEFVVSSGTGGKGQIYLRNFRFAPIDDAAVRDARGTVMVSSAAPARAPTANPPGTIITGWQAAGPGPAWLAVDFGCVRELGGLVLDWPGGGPAPGCDVLLSSDGRDWQQVASAEGGPPGRNWLYLPDQESRWLKLVVRPTAGAPACALDRLEIKGPDFGADQNAFFQAVAHDQPRGLYPRYFTPEQCYWTVVGSPADVSNALVNTDGAIEVDYGGFTIEPFLYVDGKLVTWNDVKARPSLERNYLPIPSVEWTYGSLKLTTTVFAAGPAGPDSLLVAHYRIENSGPPVKGRLFLALRPYEVNPPWQSLQTMAGWTPIHRLQLQDGVVSVDDRTVIPLNQPAAFGATRFAAGDITSYLRDGRLPTATTIEDAQGFASGALAYDFNLAAGAHDEVSLAVPFHHGPGAPRPDLAPEAAARFVAEAHAATRRRWEGLLDRFQVTLPPSAQPIIDTIKSNLAYIYVNMEGPRIQPGSRNYRRSWIRDGALTSTALLELGLNDEPRAFADWYAPYQFPSGKIPCVVDDRGADSTDENDSNGEMIYLIRQVYQYTHDEAWLRRMWPTVVKTVQFIRYQRSLSETEAFLHGTPVQQACYGLVPKSISHEGYSNDPMHSYWDDFFVLRGLKDAAAIATILGEKEQAAAFAAEREDFARDLYQSLHRAMQLHQIDYLPGCVELGDFDPTSTTIALSPGGELVRLPEPALRRTFDRYFKNFEARRDGTLAWTDFTPYENRVIGSFVLLGEKARALAVLDFLMASRRPAAWNQWAEVVFRDPQTPKMIGDMPHTWCGSDFIRSVRTMFVYEREADSALVLAAGVADAWVLDPIGVTVHGLSTYYGPIDYSIRRHPAPDGGPRCEVVVTVGGAADARNHRRRRAGRAGIKRDPAHAAAGHGDGELLTAGRHGGC